MDTVIVSFRYVGDNVDPRRVTETLGLTPRSVRVKGMPVEKHPDKNYRTGFWGIDSNLPEHDSLVAHLRQLLDLLEPHIDAIRVLAEDGYACNFYCSLFHTSENGFATLDPETLGRVARLGASIDIYTHKE